MLAVNRNFFGAVLKLSKWMESCLRSTATGSMSPDLRLQMHVRQTLFSSAELQGRRKLTTKFDLQRRNLCRAQTNMQGPIHCIALLNVYINKNTRVKVIGNHKTLPRLMNPSLLHFSITFKFLKNKICSHIMIHIATKS